MNFTAFLETQGVRLQTCSQEELKELATAWLETVCDDIAKVDPFLRAGQTMLLIRGLEITFVHWKNDLPNTDSKWHDEANQLDTLYTHMQSYLDIQIMVQDNKTTPSQEYPFEAELEGVKTAVYLYNDAGERVDGVEMETRSYVGAPTAEQKAMEEIAKQEKNKWIQRLKTLPDFESTAAKVPKKKNKSGGGGRKKKSKAKGKKKGGGAAKSASSKAANLENIKHPHAEVNWFFEHFDAFIKIAENNLVKKTDSKAPSNDFWPQQLTQKGRIEFFVSTTPCRNCRYFFQLLRKKLSDKKLFPAIIIHADRGYEDESSTHKASFPEGATFIVDYDGAFRYTNMQWKESSTASKASTSGGGGSKEPETHQPTSVAQLTSMQKDILILENLGSLLIPFWLANPDFAHRSIAIMSSIVSEDTTYYPFIERLIRDYYSITKSIGHPGDDKLADETAFIKTVPRAALVNFSKARLPLFFGKIPEHSPLYIMQFLLHRVTKRISHLRRGDELYLMIDTTDLDRQIEQLNGNPQATKKIRSLKESKKQRLKNHMRAIIDAHNSIVEALDQEEEEAGKVLADPIKASPKTSSKKRKSVAKALKAIPGHGKTTLMETEAMVSFHRAFQKRQDTYRQFRMFYAHPVLREGLTDPSTDKHSDPEYYKVKYIADDDPLIFRRRYMFSSNDTLFQSIGLKPQDVFTYITDHIDEADIQSAIDAELSEMRHNHNLLPRFFEQFPIKREMTREQIEAIGNKKRLKYIELLKKGAVVGSQLFQVAASYFNVPFRVYLWHSEVMETFHEPDGNDAYPEKHFYVYEGRVKYLLQRVTPSPEQAIFVRDSTISVNDFSPERMDDDCVILNELFKGLCPPMMRRDESATLSEPQSEEATASDRARSLSPHRFRFSQETINPVRAEPSRNRSHSCSF